MLHLVWRAYIRRPLSTTDINNVSIDYFLRGVDPKLLDAVFDMQLLCDRRGTEINHLARQMRDFALYQTADGNIPDPGIAVILKAKVNELLPRSRSRAAAHGTSWCGA